MAVTINESAFVVAPGQSTALSQMLATTASASDPTYLVLTGLDRDEYTAGESGATGSLAGSSQTEGFTGIGSDARGAGIVSPTRLPRGATTAAPTATSTSSPTRPRPAPAT